MSDVAATLERLSVLEIVDAAALGGAPRVVRAAVELAARVPSRRLGRVLARFDADVGELGLSSAARRVMLALGARVEVEGELPARDRGAALVVTNHPGAYDALATMATLGRDDVALVAAERPFLRAMPHVTQHLIFVADDRATARAAGLRRAVDWLREGHVLVQYGAGAIEPDARFVARGGEVLGAWHGGTGLLAARASQMGALVVPVFVEGVHSPRAKMLPFVRLAERRGITTIAPLVQATMPGFRDVVVRVRYGAPLAASALASAAGPEERTAIVREAVRALAR